MDGNIYDCVIIGGGPAGLAAAIYSARARHKVLIAEKGQVGGLITLTDSVTNYPGIAAVSGIELTQNMKSQAENFGAEFLRSEVTQIKADGKIKTVCTENGDFKCYSIIIATGTKPKPVGFKGEKEFIGRGVSYCATCDGKLFGGKEVFVIGGSYSAAQESVFLTRYAKKVTVLIRGNGFSCAPSVAQKAKDTPKITVLTNTEVTEALGDTTVKKLVCKNSLTHEQTVFSAENGDSLGVFVFAGYEPTNSLIKGLIETDGRGYIVTDREQKTSIDGIFAAGDICSKALRQVVTATGEGALAAVAAEKYISDLKSR